MQILGTEVTSALVNYGIPAILGLQVWMVRKVSGHDVEFAKLKTVLLGPNGDNGLNGRITKAESDIDALREKVPLAPQARRAERRRVRR
jgi:hypothetical protein